MSMRGRGETRFGVLCVGFSALLLLLSLLGAVRLTRLNDEAAALERELLALEEENAYTRAVCESSISLEELEQRAIRELGMQHRRGEQMEDASLREEIG